MALELDAMSHEFTPQFPNAAPSIGDEARSFDQARFLLADRTILPKFQGLRSARTFHAAYNGGGWFDSLTKRLCGATLTQARSGELLAEILEDALIAAGSHLMTPGRRVIGLDADGEALLKLAISERLPRVGPQGAGDLAVQLIEELKLALGSTHALAIDGGAVYCTGGRLEIIDVGPDPVRFMRTPTGVVTITAPLENINQAVTT